VKTFKFNKVAVLAYAIFVVYQLCESEKNIEIKPHLPKLSQSQK